MDGILLTACWNVCFPSVAPGWGCMFRAHCSGLRVAGMGDCLPTLVGVGRCRACWNLT